MNITLYHNHGRGASHKAILTVAVIAIISISSQLFSQGLFVEPEIGMYKPSDKDYTPKFGGNIGFAFKSVMQIYGGYKLWEVRSSSAFQFYDYMGHSDTVDRFKTIVFGIRKTFMLGGKPLGVRIGAELLMGSVYQKVVQGLDSSDFNFINEFEGKGMGGSFDWGFLFELSEKIHLFVGINYLVQSVILDSYTVNGVKVSRQELGINEGEATIDMSGTNFKVSIVGFLK